MPLESGTRLGPHEGQPAVLYRHGRALADVQAREMPWHDRLAERVRRDPWHV